MKILIAASLLLALAACSAFPTFAPGPSACAVEGEASYACQVQRYQDVNV